MKVKPEPGLIVRRPNPPYLPLKESGENVPDNSYWKRRINDGSVKEIKESEKKSKSASASNTDKK